MAKTGFAGFGIVSVSLFAQLFPARESTGALLPLMIFADCFAVLFYRQHANWKDLRRLLPATFAGIVVGWWIMPLIPDRQFALLLGWLILALMALTVLQRKCPDILRHAVEHPLLGLSAGVATGLATMLANAAGAITAFYFLAMRMDKMTFVGTTAWFYLIVNLSKVPFGIQLDLINPPIVAISITTKPVTTMVTGRLMPKTDAANTAKPKSQMAA